MPVADYYGSPPVAVLDPRERDVLHYEPSWDEFMHFLYLPVWLPPGSTTNHPAIPKSLEMLRPLLVAALHDFRIATGEPWWKERYWYVTARRGYASPDNPLNRPGWHCDGFGTDDLNWVWCDAFPTLWLDRRLPDGTISPDHIRSVGEMTDAVVEQPEYVRRIKPFRLYRFSPFVIHAAPDENACANAGLAPIEAASGLRSFVKISASRHRYNLKGNSRNWDLDYDWEMFDRSEIRNDPHYAGTDFYTPDAAGG